jgi:hypothetical protein
MRRALGRLGFWIAHSPIPEQVRMVRPAPLAIRWAFLRHDSERSFEQVRSLVIRRLLTQRFRYFVAINEIAKATSGKLPDGLGVPDVPLDWLLRRIPDGHPDRSCHHEPGDPCPRGVHDVDARAAAD